MSNESIASQLKASMSVITTRQISSMAYFQKSLVEASFVVSLQDPVRKPLQASYDGPFKIIRRKSNNFLLNTNGKVDEMLIVCHNPPSDTQVKEWVNEVPPSSECVPAPPPIDLGSLTNTILTESLLSCVCQRQAA